MDDILKSNSHKSKEQEADKKLHKVVTGKVVTKKKSKVYKFTEVFLAEDIHKVKNFIFMDVIVPTLKKAAADIVTDGINMLLYGDTAVHKRSGTTNASKVSYSGYYDNRGSENRREYNSVRTANVYNYDDICLASRAEGEEVLSCLDDAIDRYGSASVADLYDLVGITPRYTDNRYGWTNLSSASVVRIRDGWMLKLPKVIDIKS